MSNTDLWIFDDHGNLQHFDEEHCSADRATPNNIQKKVHDISNLECGFHCFNLQIKGSIGKMHSEVVTCKDSKIPSMFKECLGVLSVRPIKRSQKKKGSTNSVVAIEKFSNMCMDSTATDDLMSKDKNTKTDCLKTSVTTSAVNGCNNVCRSDKVDNVLQMSEIDSFNIEVSSSSDFHQGNSPFNFNISEPNSLNSHDMVDESYQHIERLEDTPSNCECSTVSPAQPLLANEDSLIRYLADVSWVDLKESNTQSMSVGLETKCAVKYTENLLHSKTQSKAKMKRKNTCDSMNLKNGKNKAKKKTVKMTGIGSPSKSKSAEECTVSLLRLKTQSKIRTKRKKTCDFVNLKQCESKAPKTTVGKKTGIGSLSRSKSAEKYNISLLCPQTRLKVPRATERTETDIGSVDSLNMKQCGNKTPRAIERTETDLSSVDSLNMKQCVNETPRATERTETDIGSVDSLNMKQCVNKTPRATERTETDLSSVDSINLNQCVNETPWTTVGTETDVGSVDSVNLMQCENKIPKGSHNFPMDTCLNNSTCLSRNQSKSVLLPYETSFLLPDGTAIKTEPSNDAEYSSRDPGSQVRIKTEPENIAEFSSTLFGKTDWIKSEPLDDVVYNSTEDKCISHSTYSSKSSSSGLESINRSPIADDLMTGRNRKRKHTSETPEGRSLSKEITSLEKSDSQPLQQSQEEIESMSSAFSLQQKDSLIPFRIASVFSLTSHDHNMSMQDIANTHEKDEVCKNIKFSKKSVSETHSDILNDKNLDAIKLPDEMKADPCLLSPCRVVLEKKPLKNGRMEGSKCTKCCRHRFLSRQRTPCSAQVKNCRKASIKEETSNLEPKIYAKTGSDSVGLNSLGSQSASTTLVREHTAHSDIQTNVSPLVVPCELPPQTLKQPPRAKRYYTIKVQGKNVRIPSVGLDGLPTVRYIQSLNRPMTFPGMQLPMVSTATKKPPERNTKLSYLSELKKYVVVKTMEVRRDLMYSIAAKSYGTFTRSSSK